jgi:hypothetical protein
MRIHFAVAVLGLAPALDGASSPAVAQEMLPAREAEKDLAEYADCVAGRKGYRKAVAAFLRVVPDSEASYPASMKAADLTCLNDAAVRRRAAKLEMRLQPATFRGAMYPALYRRDFGKGGPPAGLATVPPLDIAAEFSGEVGTLPSEYGAGRALGDCTARKAPQDAHALLMAKPWTAGEDAAIERLKPIMAGCISSEQTVRFDRQSFRSYLGEATYKLALAAGAPS